MNTGFYGEFTNETQIHNKAAWKSHGLSGCLHCGLRHELAFFTGYRGQCQVAAAFERNAVYAFGKVDIRQV